MNPTNLEESSREDLRKRIVFRSAQRAVRVLPHRLVVVHVHEAAAKTVGEEAGHEEREVAKASQARPLLGSAGLERTSEPECQGLRLLQVIGTAVGPHVLAEEVHEVGTL